jgi:hypothetical protein
MQCLQTSILMTALRQVFGMNATESKPWPTFASSAQEWMIVAAIAQPQKSENFGNWFR